MISLMKKTALVLSIALVGLSGIPAAVAQEPTNREVAVMTVAMKRTCSHLNPAGKYSLRNVMDDPQSGLTEEMKKEILIADKSPDYEQEIQLARDKTEGDITGRAAIALVCRNFEPPKGFWPW
ncbi:hypothetical protein [Pseudomonas frederiksbergensis]|uniref:hypothetical protein n=1 Tax=Pseudomonas frederiksbergensis TaxID=104087 RepID=UPI003D1DB6DE